MEDEFQFCVKNDGSIMLEEYHGIGFDHVVIPDCVTQVAPFAFANNPFIRCVTIPDGVKSIGHHAFFGCGSLEILRISDSAEIRRIGAYAFAETLLQRVEGGGTVKEVGQDAFEGTPWIEANGFRVCGGYLVRFNGKECDVQIPHGIHTVGPQSFAPSYWEGRELFCKRIVFPDSVQVIEEKAFIFLDTLKEIDLGTGVKIIGEEAFSHCHNLESILGGEKVHNVGRDAFRLTKVKEKTLVIGDVLVYHDSSQGELVISEGITEIASYACIELEQDELVIPMGVHVQESAFRYCFVRSLVIQDMMGIERCAFVKWEGLERVSISESSVQLACEDARPLFYNCLDKAEVVIEGPMGSFLKLAMMYRLDFCQMCRFGLDIPEASFEADSTCRPIGELTLWLIAKGVMDPVPEVKVLVFSDYSQDLREEICKTYPNVERFEILPNLQKKDPSVLCYEGVLYQTFMEEIWLSLWPPGRTGDDYVLDVETVMNYAFSYAQLKSVSFTKLRWLDERAFYMCLSLERISIPSSVAFMGDQGFESPFVECHRLKVVDVDSSNELYYTDEQGLLYSGEWGLIWAPSGLEIVELPNVCKGIGSEVFAGSHIRMIRWPNSTFKVFEHAFRECKHLETLHLPQSCCAVWYGAFNGCSNLRDVYVDNAEMYYSVDDGCKQWAPFKTNGRTVFHCIAGSTTEQFARHLKHGLEVFYPHGVKELESSRFLNATTLRGVKLPDSVEKIGESCFEGCTDLRSINIPGAVRYIGKDAFLGCHKADIRVHCGNHYAQEWFDNLGIPFQIY